MQVDLWTCMHSIEPPPQKKIRLFNFGCSIEVIDNLENRIHSECINYTGETLNYIYHHTTECIRYSWQ